MRGISELKCVRCRVGKNQEHAYMQIWSGHCSLNRINYQDWSQEVRMCFVALLLPNGISCPGQRAPPTLITLGLAKSCKRWLRLAIIRIIHG